MDLRALGILMLVATALCLGLGAAAIESVRAGRPTAPVRQCAHVMCLGGNALGEETTR